MYYHMRKLLYIPYTQDGFLPSWDYLFLTKVYASKTSFQEHSVAIIHIENARVKHNTCIIAYISSIATKASAIVLLYTRNMQDIGLVKNRRHYA